MAKNCRLNVFIVFVSLIAICSGYIVDYGPVVKATRGNTNVFIAFRDGSNHVISACNHFNQFLRSQHLNVFFTPRIMFVIAILEKCK